MVDFVGGTCQNQNNATCSLHISRLKCICTFYIDHEGQGHILFSIVYYMGAQTHG